MFTLKVSGRGRGGWNDRGTKRKHPRSTGFLSSRSNFHFNRRRCARVGRITRRGNGLKQFLTIKANFLSLFKTCVYTRARILLRSQFTREKERGGEQKGRQEFSSRSFASPLLPSFHCQSTIGQRTVLKWISIFPGVDLIKREPDFRDGNIVHEN